MKEVWKVYLGVGFEKSGRRILRGQREAGVVLLTGRISEIAGGVTVYPASGCSVECPSGEDTVVFETVVKRTAKTTRAMLDAVAEVKEYLNQGSVMVVRHKAPEVNFI